ncbi:B-cell receptor CD22-like, partial [Fundulus heteroclitus]|uniref:B-cell receptor CD22-like n=1 Tax=Fundulus heteroclitus TaxID=8078 RepID=UPI00165A639E
MWRGIRNITDYKHSDQPLTNDLALPDTLNKLFVLSLKAAGSLNIFLRVQSPGSWEVIYTQTQICAVKGSTVDISCNYTYPTRTYSKQTEVLQTLWSSEGGVGSPVDLMSDPDYKGRVQYLCDPPVCTLRITDLRESDSAQYKFTLRTNHGGSHTGSPGVTLSVTALQVQVISSEYTESYRRAELRCESSCQAGHQSYIWIKNAWEIIRETSSSLSVSVLPEDRYSCALKGFEEFPSIAVYAPWLLFVSVSPSGEIVEGSSVTLTCSSDANPAANYTWYKDNITDSLSNNSQLVFSYIQSSDSGRFSCMAKNQLGWTWSQYQHLDVKYAPQRPSVSLSPSGEIVEGSSVTLTCSSDANPPANYSWYKEDEEFPTASGQNFTITDVRPEHSGNYSCEAQNNRGSQSSTVLLTVVRLKDAPQRPSVSLSPSGEIVEGSSVTLTCSSDANPAANYSWYKEDEEFPTASGQNFTITDVRPEHSGNYSCEAQNNRGSQSSTVLLTVVRLKGPRRSAAAAGTAAVLLPLIFLCVCLWIRRKKRRSKETVGRELREANMEQEDPEEDQDLLYASLQFINFQ